MNPAKPSVLEMVLPFVLVFGIFYFLVIRPQSQRLKKQQQMLDALKPGDVVVTQSGFVGSIHQVQDRLVILELSPNVRVPILKRYIIGLKDDILKSESAST